MAQVTMRSRRSKQDLRETATLISTGTRSTSTPAKSDETPREAPFGGAYDAAYVGVRDAAMRRAAAAGTLSVPLLEPFDPRPAKVSSPELASLAADFMNRANLVNADLPAVKRLAASVLSQAEGDKPK